MRFSTLTILAAVASLGNAGYVLQDDYEPSNFFSKFSFWTAADPTDGYVTYISQSAASSAGLISSSSSSVYMGVDHTNVASGSGRQSVRITSNSVYNHGLFILDASHMPQGCGTWPAFWTVGPNWPSEGEIDVIEGVNSQSLNLMSLHTSSGCTVSNNGLYTGTTGMTNCDTDANGNTGCQITETTSQSFGSGFNGVNGGVYAMEWTSSAISIWFFPRSSIPSDITSGSPNPSGWSEATAVFSGGCTIDSFFMNHQIVFDTTFCGTWAGAVWSSDSTCSALASSCNTYVQNNPSAFANAYWSINSLKVYSSSAGSSSTTTTSKTSTSTSATTTTTGSTLTTTASTTSTTSSSTKTSTTSSTTKTTTSSTTTSTRASFTQGHHRRRGESSPNEKHVFEHQHHRRHARRNGQGPAAAQ